MIPANCGNPPQLIGPSGTCPIDITVAEAANEEGLENVKDLVKE